MRHLSHLAILFLAASPAAIAKPFVAAGDEGCALISGLSGTGFGATDLSTTSGIESLDAMFVHEMSIAVVTFKVLPALMFLDDTRGANAFATPKKLREDASPRSSGTLLFGMTLLKNEYEQEDSRGYSIPGIIGHEMAHMVQFKKGLSGLTKWKELHADYLAGWFVAARLKASGLSRSELVPALNSIFKKGDTNFNDPNHHGTPPERLEAAKAGSENPVQNIDRAYDDALAYVKSKGGFPDEGR